MTTFLRVLNDDDKEGALLAAVNGGTGRRFSIDPSSFRQIPGSPFAYWVSNSMREGFQRLPRFEGQGRTSRVGLQTSDDLRFVRLWWESTAPSWRLFAKGGVFSPFYADIYLVVNWERDGIEICSFADPKTGQINSRPQNIAYYLRPGLTWPSRTTSRFGLRAMPTGCIFGHKGPAAFVGGDNAAELLMLLALANSRAFSALIELQLAAGDAAARSYEVGVIQRAPIPTTSSEQHRLLASLARRAWWLQRSLDTVTETSHAFVMPAPLRSRASDYDPQRLETELAQIQSEVDAIAFELYGFSDVDRLAATGSDASDIGDVDAEEDDEEDLEVEARSDDALFSWAVGVAFGRFDWRLATGERQAPPDPEPFDQLPAKSPGMLPDGAEPFHAYAGIVVDDPGHDHDLARIIEEVLERVGVAVPNDVRSWLQRQFFAFHLQRYSKSRRKAPIYWPLATASGSYTVWVYYPHLNSQTLYTAVNDFVEPKLTQVAADAAVLRGRGAARTRGDEKTFEALQALELELADLRDGLLKIAPHFHPSHDDGVQITASPLWPLFRHKPWQKVLKETWAKLERGDFDWAHLALNYWPERVREKCKTDKSLSIAHGLEGVFVEPRATPKKSRVRRRPEGVE